MDKTEKTPRVNASDSYDGGMKAVSRMLQSGFILLLLVILIMLVRFISFGGYFAVKAQEAVIVTQFGKYKDVYTKDWHWFLPYPVSRFINIKTSPQFLNIYFNSAEALLMPGSPIPPLQIGRDRYLVTGDGNILHSEWRISYRISEPRKFYETCLTSFEPSKDDEIVYDGDVALGLRGPQTMLKNLFTEAAVAVTSAYSVRDIYDTKRSVYADEVKSLFARKLKAADLGIVAEDVVLNAVTPPGKTAPAFNEVAVAMNRKAALKNQAEEYRVNLLNNANQEVSRIKAEANAYSTEVVAEIKSESIYFTSIAKEYKENPHTVLMALYNNTLAEVLSLQEGKYIIGGSGGNQQLRLKLNPEAPKRAKSKSQSEVK